MTTNRHLGNFQETLPTTCVFSNTQKNLTHIQNLEQLKTPTLVQKFTEN